MSLKRSVFSGVLWNVGQRGLAASVSFLVTLVLARLVAPEDFGVIAMMAVFIAIARSLMDSGMSQALIRLAEPSEADFDTALISNLSFGILAYVFVYVTAPLAADFYDEPRLALMLRITALVVPINSMSAVQVALLMRQLDFKRQLKITIPSQIASGVIAIALGMLGFGAWALIAQMMVSSIFVGIGYWGTSAWRPSGRFEIDSFRRLYGFGSKLWASSLLDTFFRNIYIIAIAKMFAPALAGQYFFADKMRSLLLNQVVGAVGSVTYPALSRLGDDDTRLRVGYRKVVQVTTFFLFPVLLLTAALAQDLFAALLSPDWAPAATYLQLLCFASLLFPLQTLNLNILKVKGRSDLFLGLEVIKKACSLLVIAITIRHGVIAMLIGQVFQSILVYIPNSWYSRRLIGYSVPSQLQDCLPQLFIALASAGLALGISHFVSGPPVIGLAIGGTVGLGTFLLGAHFLRVPALSETMEIIRASMKEGKWKGLEKVK